MVGLVTIDNMQLSFSVVFLWILSGQYGTLWNAEQ